MNKDLLNNIEDQIAEVTFVVLGAGAILKSDEIADIIKNLETVVYEYTTHKDEIYEGIGFNRLVLDVTEEIQKEIYENNKDFKTLINQWIEANKQFLKKRSMVEISLNEKEIEEIEKPLKETINKLNFTHNNAQIQVKEEEKEKILKILLFQMRDVIYGIESTKIVEIKHINNEDITHIPNVADCVLGLFNLRGEVIPLIDLRIFLNIKEKTEIDYNNIRENMIIAVKYENKITGLLVDKAVDFKDIEEKSIINTNFKDIKQEYVHGVIHSEEYDLIISLNIDEFLNEQHLHDNFLLN